jgi:hypothetical protein
MPAQNLLNTDWLNHMYLVYLSIVHFFLKLGSYTSRYFGWYASEHVSTKPIISYLDNDMKYIQPLKTRFLVDISGGIANNQNIVPVFYNKKEFGEVVAVAENFLEKEWRTRILLENTPRGNVIMYFDAYKLGFAYYCDQSVVSYDILNAMAMKYVRLYSCRDFFMDETFCGSPLIKIHLLEEPKKPIDLSGGKVVIGGSSAGSGKSPFAKLRNYAKENKDTVKDKDTKDKDTKDANTEEKEKNKNKFMYLGKINNFKILQGVPKKRKVLARFTSPLLEGIKTDALNVQRERVSYSEFKKMIKKQE